MEGKKIQQIEIIDIAGKKNQIINNPDEKTKLNLNSRHKGIYFINIKINNSYITRKILFQ